jgi:hypothetical protein
MNGNISILKASYKKWATSAKLSDSAQRIYKILIKRVIEGQTPFVTLSVKDAAKFAKVKNDRTLARIRKELIHKELIRLAPTTPGQSYIYELIIPKRFSRGALGAVLSNTDRGRVRTYSADNVRWVAEMLLSDAADPSCADALVYRCPFHPGNEYSLSVTPSKNLWQCRSSSCIRHGKAKGYKGGGNLIALVSACKLQMDRRRYGSNSKLIHPAQAREVIAQIIDSTADNHVASVDDLTYTKGFDSEGNSVPVRFVDDRGWEDSDTGDMDTADELESIAA